MTTARARLHEPPRTGVQREDGCSRSATWRRLGIGTVKPRLVRRRSSADAGFGEVPRLDAQAFTRPCARTAGPMTRQAHRGDPGAAGCGLRRLRAETLEEAGSAATAGARSRRCLTLAVARSSAQAAGAHRGASDGSVRTRTWTGSTAASEGRDAEETRELSLATPRPASADHAARGTRRVHRRRRHGRTGAPGRERGRRGEGRRRTASTSSTPWPSSTLDWPRGPECSTGEAAVTIGAIGQGMVAGDLVNTASRSSQSPSLARSWSVRRPSATEAAVAYASAGEHELKASRSPLRSTGRRG